MEVENQTKKRWPKLCLAAGCVIGVLFAICAIYLNQEYHAIDVNEYLASSQTLSISEEDFGVFFDGPGTDRAIVFYQGAKVDATAYAPVLSQLAKDGIDCFLVEMPYNIAFFDMKKADEVLERYTYDKWYMMGHSLGGVAASGYAIEKQNQIDGVIFLASYPTKNLNASSLRVLSIFGSEDQVLNRKRFESAKQLMPNNYKELCIEGGNHAGFGSYGHQKGDGEATISIEEQWNQTTNAIETFIYEGE